MYGAYIKLYYSQICVFNPYPTEKILFSIIFSLQIQVVMKIAYYRNLKSNNLFPNYN
jgi:hypothetical protein